MKVIGFDPIMTREAADRLGIELVGLDEIFRRSDFITVHTPLTDDTRGLIGRAAFEKMKKGVRIINCARGGIVDEAALAEAITSGKVAGAALDVFVEEPPSPDNPLLKLDNVVVTPHLGAATEEAQVQVAIDIAQQVADFLLEGTVESGGQHPGGIAERTGSPRTASDARREARTPRRPAHHRDSDRGDDRSRWRGRESEGRADHRRGGEGTPRAASSTRHLNYVNAPFIARERGVTINETRSRESTDFVNTLSVTVRTAAGEHQVAGAVLGNRAMRLIRIDGFSVESVPEGYFLMLRNRDVPGVVGTVGTLLGAGAGEYRGAGPRARSRGRHGAQPVRGGRSGARRGAR